MGRLYTEREALSKMAVLSSPIEKFTVNVTSEETVIAEIDVSDWFAVALEINNIGADDGDVTVLGCVSDSCAVSEKVLSSTIVSAGFGIIVKADVTYYKKLIVKGSSNTSTTYSIEGIKKRLIGGTAEEGGSSPS